MTGGLVHRVRPAAGPPAGAFVVVHGRGADELDLLPLLDAVDPERRLVGLAPRGPLSLPPSGAHWYAVREIGRPDPRTFLPSYERLSRWIDGTLAERGVPHDRAVIGGFSQGAAMSYATALGAGRPSPAGIVALSGFLPDVDGFELDLERPRLPVAIGHGSLDPILGVDLGRAARDRLAGAGMDVLYRESPMAHTVDPALLAELRPWLERVVPAT